MIHNQQPLNILTTLLTCNTQQSNYIFDLASNLPWKNKTVNQSILWTCFLTSDKQETNQSFDLYLMCYHLDFNFDLLLLYFFCTSPPNLYLPNCQCYQMSPLTLLLHYYHFDLVNLWTCFCPAITWNPNKPLMLLSTYQAHQNNNLTCSSFHKFNKFLLQLDKWSRITILPRLALAKLSLDWRMYSNLLFWACNDHCKTNVVDVINF